MQREQQPVGAQPLSGHGSGSATGSCEDATAHAPDATPRQVAPVEQPGGAGGQGPEQAQGSLHATAPGGNGSAAAAGSAQAGAQGQQSGPEMGQPHFSSQFPGAAPYQGAPLSYGGAADPMGPQPQMMGGYAGTQQPQQQMMGGYGGAQQPQPQMMGGYAGTQQPQQQMMGGYAGTQQPQQQPGTAPMGAPYGFAGAEGYAQTVQGPQYQAQGGAYMPQGAYQGYYSPQGAAYTPQGAPAGAFQGYQTVPGAAPSAFMGTGQENRYGELYGLIQEAANGNADVSRFMQFFQNTSTDFWKGALIGTGLTLLFTNDAVKSAIARGFAGIWGAVGKKAEEAEAEEDRKAEERAAREA